MKKITVTKSNIQHKIKWSPREIKLLKNLYPLFWVSELADKFPHRTKATIIAKATALKLPSAKLWQPKEIDTLRKEFIDSPQEIITSLLPNRSWAAIMMEAERLGLKRKRNKPKKSVNEDYFKIWSPSMAYIFLQFC